MMPRRRAPSASMSGCPPQIQLSTAQKLVEQHSQHLAGSLPITHGSDRSHGPSVDALLEAPKASP